MIARRILLPIILSLALAGASPSEAQVTTSLERLEIVLWPEYDRPALLVMLRAWLPADTPLGTFVPLPIPAGVSPSAVALRDASGELLLAAHTVIDHRFYQEVRVKADSLEIRVEYYEPMNLDGADRSHVFNWPGGLEVGSVRYELQRPFGAGTLQVSPSPDTEAVGFDGLTYLAADLGSSGVEEALSIEFSYTKTSPGLTLNSLQPPPNPATASPAPPPVVEEPPVAMAQEVESFPWLIIMPAVLIVGLILMWFLQSSPKQ